MGLLGLTTARGAVMLTFQWPVHRHITPGALPVATRFRSTAPTGPTLYTGAASAEGLRADRTDISFQNITPDLVRVDVRVTNDGSLWSPPTEVALQSAPLGAFVTWQPLLTLAVPSLPPRTSAVVSGTAWVPQPAPVARLEEAWSMPAHLLREYAETAAREAQEELEREARRLLRRPAPVVAADPLALLGRAGYHWAGNIDILMRGKAAERHMAQALRVYPGKTNAAMFYVGDRRDGYKFELSGDVEDWRAELVDMTHSPTLRPGGAPGVPTSEFREMVCGTFYLLLRPPQGAERGAVSIHVTRQSDGKEAVVEFSLDSRAAGSGCYTV
jgi:hypothetical protein